MKADRPKEEVETHPLDIYIPADWLAEFDAAARRPLETRFRYAFIHTYKPMLDHAPVSCVR